MHYRVGFVSNSSSSSYIIDFYVRAPKIPKTDTDLTKLLYGNTQPMCALEVEGADSRIKYPLDIPSATNAARQFLEKSMPAVQEGYDAYLIKRIAKDTDWLHETRELMASYAQKKEFAKEYKKHVERVQNADKHFPFANKTLDQAFEMFSQQFPLEDTRLIVSSYEVSDGHLFGRKNNPTEGKILGRHASLDCLFQNLPHAETSWRVESNHAPTEDYWKDRFDQQKFIAMLERDPQYATYMRLKDRFDRKRKAFMTTREKLLGKKGGFEV